MRFSVPFLPDEAYAGVLARNAAHLASCYFSLHLPVARDARVRAQTVETERLSGLLAAVDVPEKLALLNARFHEPAAYFDRDLLRDLASRLARLRTEAGLTGVVFADASFLLALADEAPDLCAELSAVPSVNLFPDSVPAVRALVEFVSGTPFRAPVKITLDRSLNRRPEELGRVAAACRELVPGMAVEVLANEGCLPRCPFKLCHDSQVALSNTGLVSERTREVNRRFGCMRVLAAEPWRLFSSPFIRPEDVGAYEGAADVVKLCGRTLGPEFLARCLDAYVSGKSPANLLDLMDSMDWLARVVHVESGRLPEDFLARMAACPGDCSRCGTCRDLYRAAARESGTPFERLPEGTAGQSGSPKYFPEGG